MLLQVKPDFYLYDSGIYTYSREPEFDQKHDHNLVGTHSVKVIGWGEERGSKYWVSVIIYMSVMSYSQYSCFRVNVVSVNCA